MPIITFKIKRFTFLIEKKELFKNFICYFYLLSYNVLTYVILKIMGLKDGCVALKSYIHNCLFKVYCPTDKKRSQHLKNEHDMELSGLIYVAVFNMLSMCSIRANSQSAQAWFPPPSEGRKG